MLAFGHGHPGPTLAPTTARIIVVPVAGRAPPGPLAPGLSARF